MDSDEEWGPLYKVSLKEIIKNKSDCIDLSIKAKSTNSFDGAILVVTLEVDGESIYWTSVELETPEVPDILSPEWNTYHVSLRLSDVYLNYSDVEFKTLIWNKGKSQFLIDDFKIELRDGNELVYGVFKKFQGLLCVLMNLNESKKTKLYDEEALTIYKS